MSIYVIYSTAKQKKTHYKWQGPCGFAANPDLPKFAVLLQNVACLVNRYLAPYTPKMEFENMTVEQSQETAGTLTRTRIGFKNSLGKA